MKLEKEKMTARSLLLLEFAAPIVVLPVNTVDTLKKKPMARFLSAEARCPFDLDLSAVVSSRALL